MRGDDELARERDAEQRQLDLLYVRLDELEASTAAALEQVRRAPTVGTPGAQSERDAFAALHSERLAQLRAVEDRLCFGRLDLASEERRYIGRIGLSDEEHAQLLVDWRAPAAEPFYQATAAAPQGVVRRRHLSTRDRKVTGIEDEVLDLDALDPEQVRSVSGEGALLVALNSARTGRMRDIVGTIQAEQDRVIRAPLAGVLVVQGGPGTGKTAVALHRAAYLLYTYRDRIAKSGVLVVGPNQVFLRYIEQVLPSLGETGVVMATPGQLYPGVDAVADEDPRVAALKGDARMAGVIRAAVRARQRVPREPRRLDVDGTPITLEPADVEAARARARRSRKPHNLARVVFVRDLLGRLARALAAALGVEADEDHRPGLLAALRGSRDVRREVNLCWMPLTPERLLRDLYADEARLAPVAGALSRAERRLLRRDRRAPWTPADVPLLDEAAELLGEDDTADRAERARAAEERRAELAYARGVLQLSGAGGMVTAETLADRYATAGPTRSVAERAGEDRSWTFGHVVVDEAQELSPMTWRLLMRRCPSRSMTVVGDVAQTGSLGGARSWGEVLDPYVPGRWRLEELTVNYRTPRQIMAVAADVLDAAGITGRTPDSVRDGEWPPTAARMEGLASVRGAVVEELDRLGAGKLAVIVPRAGQRSVAAGLAEALPPGTVAAGPRALDSAVSVLTATEAKGLEFDAVVLLEPRALLAESPRGANDLYVALTRPTQRLRVLYTGELPTGLSRLQSPPSVPPPPAPPPSVPPPPARRGA